MAYWIIPQDKAKTVEAHGGGIVLNYLGNRLNATEIFGHKNIVIPIYGYDIYFEGEQTFSQSDRNFITSNSIKGFVFDTPEEFAAYLDSLPFTIAFSTLISQEVTN